MFSTEIGFSDILDMAKATDTYTIDNVTAVSGATNEHVLTKDTGTGNATCPCIDATPR